MSISKNITLLSDVKPAFLHRHFLSFLTSGCNPSLDTDCNNVLARIEKYVTYLYRQEQNCMLSLLLLLLTERKGGRKYKKGKKKKDKTNIDGPVSPAAVVVYLYIS